MKLIGKEVFQSELWQQSGLELLNKFPQPTQDAYPFIFALNDWKSLLLLQNETVQQELEFIQSCLIESMIQLSLNEIMHPLQYQTKLIHKGQIELASQSRLGTIHRISEINHSPLWELSRWVSSGENISCEEKLRLASLDETIDSIASLESKWREQRSIFRKS